MIEISDRAGHAQQAIESPCREAEAVDRMP
jgi:hypothetical protein